MSKRQLVKYFKEMIECGNGLDSLMQDAIEELGLDEFMVEDAMELAIK